VKNVEQCYAGLAVPACTVCLILQQPTTSPPFPELFATSNTNVFDVGIIALRQTRQICACVLIVAFHPVERWCTSPEVLQVLTWANVITWFILHQ